MKKAVNMQAGGVTAGPPKVKRRFFFKLICAFQISAQMGLKTKRAANIFFA